MVSSKKGKEKSPQLRNQKTNPPKLNPPSYHVLTEEELIQEVNTCMEICLELASGVDQMMPIALVVTKDNERAIVGMHFSDNEEKRKSQHILRRYVDHLDAKAVIMQTEGWMLKQNQSTDNDYAEIAPSQSPFRREVITIIGKTPLHGYCLMQEISRDPEFHTVGEPTVLPKESIVSDSFLGKLWAN